MESDPIQRSDKLISYDERPSDTNEGATSQSTAEPIFRTSAHQYDDDDDNKDDEESHYDATDTTPKSTTER